MIKIGIKPIIINPFKEEIWVDVEGFEDFYAVSNAGRVKSKDRIIKTKNGCIAHYKERILSQETIHDGHKRVVFSKNNINYKQSVHRIVAKAFVENVENLPIVNHLNGNPAHNEPENLEWTTISGNIKHAYDMGLLTIDHIIEANSKPVLMFDNITDELVREFKSFTEASQFSNIPINTISYQCNNMNKSIKHKYYFRFKE